MDSEIISEPYNYLQEAKILNKKFEIVPWDWFKENADVIVLLFVAKGIDREGIVEKFYEIYENAKYTNIPIEVIYVPTDDNEKDMLDCYEEQANWFTLNIHDPLVIFLKFIYNITCIPHLVVTKTDGTIISSHGQRDLEVYGKNALISWLSTACSMKNHRQMSTDSKMYGEKWIFMNVGLNTKRVYKKKFTNIIETPK